MQRIPKVIKTTINKISKDIDIRYQDLENDVLALSKDILLFFEKSSIFKCRCFPSEQPGFLYNIKIYEIKEENEKFSLGEFFILDAHERPGTKNLFILMSNTGYFNPLFTQLHDKIQENFGQRISKITEKNISILERILNIKKFFKNMGIDFVGNYEYRWLWY